MSEPTADGEIFYGTLVANGDAGVLLRGASGSGKSDLALRLMGLGGLWRLVSDDQVVLARVGSNLVGRAPAPIAGKLEVRGIGIIEVENSGVAEIRLIVDLAARQYVPRLPEPGESEKLLGVAIPRFKLHGFDASSPLKIALLLRAGSPMH